MRAEAKQHKFPRALMKGGNRYYEQFFEKMLVAAKGKDSFFKIPLKAC